MDPENEGAQVAGDGEKSPDAAPQNIEGNAPESEDSTEGVTTRDAPATAVGKDIQGTTQLVEVVGDPVGDGVPLWLIGGGMFTVVVLLIAATLSLTKRRALDVDEPERLEDFGARLTDVPSAAADGGLVARLRTALGRSRSLLQGRFDDLFGGPVDEQLFEELEETLLVADVGVHTAERLVGAVRSRSHGEDVDAEALKQALRDEMTHILVDVEAGLQPPDEGPFVILVVGVNGSGKTTTIGKLAARFSNEGKKVMLAAGDTYRAAAAEQLAVWADRANAEIVRQDSGADPASVAYQALEAAKARGCDVVIIDTAGRLQTRKPLMEQLTKIRRVIDKQVPGAPHETLLVLDGTIGQNGLSQAQLFNEATPLTGVVVTKLDGTAKGGMVLTVSSEMRLPVKLIGIGEGVEDLRDFESTAFVDALAG